MNSSCSRVIVFDTLTQNQLSYCIQHVQASQHLCFEDTPSIDTCNIVKLTSVQNLHVYSIHYASLLCGCTVCQTYLKLKSMCMLLLWSTNWVYILPLLLYRLSHAGFESGRSVHRSRSNRSLSRKHGMSVVLQRLDSNPYVGTPYLSKLESIASSAVRVAEKVKRDTV